ncbi:hypothetical protein MKW92_019083 [Papaver armeniacum]|nr:hypothetical protein MKW92_019083 [Papaver armeniacum]
MVVEVDETGRLSLGFIIMVGDALSSPLAKAINSAAKSNHMFFGQISVPSVFRGLKGAAPGFGAHQSQKIRSDTKFHVCSVTHHG